jgi:hypothetical protein
MDSRQQTTPPVVLAGPPPPPSYIKAATPFSPLHRQCCQCQQTTPAQTQPQTTSCTCDHELCHSCHHLDGRGGAVIPHAFPAAWACSTCSETHSVLSILTQKVSCKCGSPTLQAIYDQFGRIFLFWRDDPAVYDLVDPAKVQEAAWRVWEAGAEPWLADVLAAERAEEERQGRLKGKGWGRLSQSSVLSDESLDIEIEIVEVTMECV